MRLLIVFIFALILTGCNNPEDALPQGDLGDGRDLYNEGVFIVNEGNFDWGFGTLSHYDREGEEVTNAIFKKKNGHELGNVVQSLYILDSVGYLPINNSSRVEIVDVKTMEWLGRIEIPKSSPRYFYPVTQSKAYVTDIYADRFYVVNTETNALEKDVQVGGWTEKMISHDDFIYMTQTRTAYDTREGGQLLLKIDKISDVVIDSLKMPVGPIDIQKDKNNNLWVLCNGGLGKAKPSLVKVDVGSFKIKDIFEFESKGLEQPSRLRINAAKDELYYIYNDVFKFNITDSNLPQTPIIPANGRLFYALGIDPISNEIYTSDAFDYVQQGMVFKYDYNGKELHSFTVGVIPNEFVFNYN
ncbi:DUF5074 domain-containing protein [Sediminitomix flava]|uniref:DNA-binding beta-propeller fold protein YncE n=1 Tax=Sediminitomix flava TaxID=379075 RepID=A0A315ZAP2_SEDFL|nr:DUF5074 domain-containing protein [Sediminitomix flava]PWJ42219.1 hypothetical protein BC781_103471 [Sediminitomix flava]